MAKVVKFGQGLRSVLFWSIISAAFIGPGTVTTAAKAGASFQLQILWALVFSVFATIVLQEAAARITIASGKNLGEIIAENYKGSGKRWQVFLFLAVAIGCAAYQAGNILGAVSGIELISANNKKILTLAIGIICAVVLWFGSFRLIANFLAIIVAGMGAAFLYVAFQTDISFIDVITSGVSPSLPNGSLLLIIGLIGTTIVPYNLFLASGISKGQSIREMRIGIIVAVLIGGIISVAILVVGTQVQGAFSFEALAQTLASKLGDNASLMLGLGLFAAGISSSITAPLAAAVTAKSLLGDSSFKWETKGNYYRGVWGGILLIGLLFGLLEVKPIPAIILAQALNGILLPVVAIFLFFAVNNKKLLTKEHTNNFLFNVFFLLIVGITSFLGFNNIFNAIKKLIPGIENLPILTINAILGVSIMIILAARQIRTHESDPD